MNTFLNKLAEYAATGGVRLVTAIVLLLVGWFLIGKLVKAVDKAKAFQKIDKTVRSFTVNLINITAKVLLVIIAAGVLGVDMTSFVAIFATLGVTVGLALQGGLSNIVGGLIILIFKPFKIDDDIDANGIFGKVNDINMFYTLIKTPDNKVVYLPNSSVSNGNIINYSAEKIRRVDFEFGVEYGTNTDGVKALLMEIAKRNDKVLDTPAPTARIADFEDSAIKVNLRVWCNTENYWEVFFSINEAVKAGFDKCGVVIPFNQLTVHLDK